MRMFHRSSFSNWCTVELKKKNDESRKRIKLLDKHHMKDFKTARNKICTKIDTIDKLRRKLKVVKQQEASNYYRKVFIQFDMRSGVSLLFSFGFSLIKILKALSD